MSNPANMRLINPLERPIRTARDRVQGVVRDIVAGGQEPSPREWDPDDPGFFREGHAVRIVQADAAAFIGGIRSILLQSLHPKAMYAVSQHSAFRQDPLGRLQRTSAFLGATIFGSGTEAQQAVDIVRKVHTRVEGVMPDGEPYAASDPHLLRWVHITEVDSFLRAFQQYGTASVSPSQADEYVDGMARVGLALGMEDAPRSVAELANDLERYRPELHGTPWSEEATLFLASPPLPLSVLPAYGLMFAAATASLPWWARNMLMLPVPPGIDRLAIRPVAKLMTRSLTWALQPSRG